MKARDLSKVLKAVRINLDDDCSVQKLLILMTVAEAGQSGIDQQALLDKAGTTRSNTSKLIADLSTITHRKAAGPGVVRSDADPINLRTRIIKLTAKGEEVVGSILEGQS